MLTRVRIGAWTWPGKDIWSWHWQDVMRRHVCNHFLFSWRWSQMKATQCDKTQHLQHTAWRSVKLKLLRIKLQFDGIQGARNGKCDHKNLNGGIPVLDMMHVCHLFRRKIKIILMSRPSLLTLEIVLFTPKQKSFPLPGLHHRPSSHCCPIEWSLICCLHTWWAASSQLAVVRVGPRETGG